MVMSRTIRKNRYNKKTYDQIPVRVKKGEKEAITACAQYHGMSTNAFIVKAVEEFRKKLHLEMIDDLKKIVAPVARRHGVEAVYLFGSRARGDYHGQSDFDFYIKKGRLRGYFALGGFYEDLKEAVNSEIDVVSLEEENLDTYIKDAIRKDGVLLYENA